METLGSGVGIGGYRITMPEEVMILRDRHPLPQTRGACFAAGRGILTLGTGSVRHIEVPEIHQLGTQKTVYAWLGDSHL